MNHISVFAMPDPEAERRKVLAKIYSLLIRLEEENEKEKVGIVKDKEKPEPLKSNIPLGQ